MYSTTEYTFLRGLSSDCTEYGNGIDSSADDEEWNAR